MGSLGSNNVIAKTSGESLGLYRARMAEKLLFGGESAEFAINAAAKINAIPE